MNRQSSNKRMLPNGQAYDIRDGGPYELRRPLSLIRKLPVIVRQGSVLIFIVVLSNFMTHKFASSGFLPLWDSSQESKLYLIDKAEAYVYDLDAFEKKVRHIAGRLQIKPEWLMAVMYSESKFDPSVFNYQGSGAVGLIQFSPEVAKRLNVSVERLASMDAIQQLDYVYQYFRHVQVMHREFRNLTDIYLAVLAPEALGQDDCYTIYAKPSRAFEQNAILDENQDGAVTVSDIDRRMERMFPTAYWLGSELLSEN